MKKILFFMVIMPMVLFTACSSDEEGNNISIELSNKTIDIPYQGEGTIKVLNVEVEKCNVSIEDNYFADAQIRNGKINISANKVGTTTLIVSYGNSKEECTINIIPVVNYVGIPITEFGKSSSYIIDKEDNQLLLNEGDRIEFYDKKILFGAYHFYNFKNDKLEYILTKIDMSRFSGGDSLPIFIERVGKSLQERYEYIEPYTGVYQKIYIYTFKHKYYIGARLAGGNGGWYLCYALTLDKVKEILDEHPSTAL